MQLFSTYSTTYLARAPRVHCTSESRGPVALFYNTSEQGHASQTSFLCVYLKDKKSLEMLTGIIVIYESINHPEQKCSSQLSFGNIFLNIQRENET